MGCPCQNNSNAYASPTIITQTPQVNTNCQFTEEILNTWKDKLLCVKNQSLYETVNIQEKDINVYLGVVLSALNNTSNICYFESHLQTISPKIIQIIVLSQC